MNPPTLPDCHADFSERHYRELLQIARQSYAFVTYREIPRGQRFILWRHDCDLSLERALALATVEREESIQSTFFLNPHCGFYNLLAAEQSRIVAGILEMGHDIGLHFDAAFYPIDGESKLEDLVGQEAQFLQRIFGVAPAAFSFHNPSAFDLTCEADIYGGLINCYSKRFKTEVAYCSDSNGYWRFRRLFDVLSVAKDSSLQVLTHPEWWQEKPMPPRQRIFRSVYGRANATLQRYDKDLAAHGRENLAGKAQAIRFLEPIDLRLFELCDYLWNTEQLATLFNELWRLHESQIRCLCKAVLCKNWRVPACEVDAFFEAVRVDGWRLFNCLFGDAWKSASGQDEATHLGWLRVHNQLVHGCNSVEPAHLEAGCVYLCAVIQAIAAWGKASPFTCDGLAPADSDGPSASYSDDAAQTDPFDGRPDGLIQFDEKRWDRFVETVKDRQTCA